MNFLGRIESWLNTLLRQFPESGTPMPEFGEGVRRVVYKRYSFLYRVQGKVIEILTLYRENLP
jgi:plasmid stabilization system protein ParE